MIYRNEIMNPSQLSINPLINKQRKQKYRAHLQKIFQIQNRQYQPRKQAKLIQNKINKLTKLKQFSRLYKQKQQQAERLKNDHIMLQHILQRQQQNNYKKIQQQQLRKTRSTIKFNSRIVSISSSKKIFRAQTNDDIKHQNMRLVKSISENSFDQSKFRKTLKQSTKDYLKIRAHMRRIKGEKQIGERLSLKKLKTQPNNLNQQDTYNQTQLQEQDKMLNRALPINIISNLNQQELQQYRISNAYRTNKLSQSKQTHQQKKQTIKSLIRKSSSKNTIKLSKKKKKMFTQINQSLTQIIDKKLNNIQ